MRAVASGREELARRDRSGNETLTNGHGTNFEAPVPA
jgi:hypothetical protein